MKKEPTVKELLDVIIAMRKIWHIDQTENYHNYILELEKLIAAKEIEEREAFELWTKNNL